MTARFADKVALVTGGGANIGRATARAFAREGATVVVAGRRPDPLDQTVELIEKDGGKASAVVADVTSYSDVERLVETTVNRHGGLHVAFNNAGIFDALGPVAAIDEEAWNRIISTNLTGVFLSMQHEMRHMARYGGGTIVNMSSSVGPHLAVPMLGAYGATKAAVSSLTRTAAREAIAEGVRINAISPGPSDTPMSMQPGETEADRAERMKHQLPIGRVGSLDEIVAAVLFLASEESGFVVGHDLVIDGGGSA
ncbi:MAG: SDR family NAD(P)-dependent oxidoreductase [Pseudonocardiaceae bacterium]